ncbi:protein of unknown function (plasmid) [Ralstonia solanacearum PSI07]|nr:protein of unknown function [Ralstonia solanacearum PSI07]
MSAQGSADRRSTYAHGTSMLEFRRQFPPTSAGGICETMLSSKPICSEFNADGLPPRSTAFDPSPSCACFAISNSIFDGTMVCKLRTG